MNVEFETEGELYDGKLAVCVKLYNLAIDGLNDEGLLDRAYTMEQEVFWEDAVEIAREHGYDYVFFGGRSSGWLIPFRQPAARALKCYSWPGQGGNMGYPIYPDPESAEEQEIYMRFRRAIEQRLKDAKPNVVNTYLQLEKECAPKGPCLSCRPIAEDILEKLDPDEDIVYGKCEFCGQHTWAPFIREDGE